MMLPRIPVGDFDQFSAMPCAVHGPRQWGSTLMIIEPPKPGKYELDGIEFEYRPNSECKALVGSGLNGSVRRKFLFFLKRKLTE